ncbi:hypothetical protein C8R44DRAFT_741574 [Mycena epipterygia]|nr:hypothetical protein C8R44DRAFT_741574 [Mycena epipterygia]
MSSHRTEESRPPALELPYELSSQIFIYCLPLHHRVRPTRKRAPLQLAQICSQWRAVAPSTPKLWSSIYLEFPAGGPYDGIPMLLGIPGAEAVQDHTCDLLKLWLARAADYPLSITLICADGLLDVIAQHSAHWARIELKLAKADFLDFNRIPGPFPALRTLGISITDYHGKFPVVNAFRDAPDLRALNGLDQLSRLTPGPNFELLPASLITLQTVEISPNTPLEDFLRILNHFPRLLHLAIRCWNTVPRQGVVPRALTAHGVPVALGRESQSSHPASDDILPHLQRLIISETLHIGTYVPFLAVLRTRRGLVHAELQMWSRHKHIWRRLAPPGPDLVAEFEELSAQGLSIRVVTPNYAWPWDIRDEDAVGDLASSVLIPTNSDYDIFESKTTPYYLAPF